MSQLGEVFDDGLFTLAKYERVERLYLDAIERTMTRAGVYELTVSQIELVETESVVGMQLREGLVVTRDAALEISKLELREELSCRLDHGDSYYVHFGFDYYLYVGSSTESWSEIAAIECSGLWVEHDFPSPYAIED
jgi:hypothetical protein